MNAITIDAYRSAREVPTGAIIGQGVADAIKATSWPVAEARDHRDVTYHPGQTIYHEGDEAEFYFEILSGTVRCCRLTTDGRRQIYRFAGAGEMIGLSGEEEYCQSAEAVTEVSVRHFRLHTLDAAMAENRALRQRVVQVLRDELAAIHEQMMLLGRMTATEKVASFLLSLSSDTIDGGYVYIPMVRADIADYLGLTLETVSRKMSFFKQAGVIEFATATKVYIKDAEGLEALAEAS